MLNRIAAWYNGEDVITEYGNEDQSVIILPSTHTEYHWTAKFVRVLIKFYLNHWKWLITTLVAILVLVVAFLTFANKRLIKKEPREPSKKYQNNKYKSTPTEIKI